MWTVPIASLAAQCWPQLPHHRGFTMTDTPQSVGVLCRIDQPVAETATWKHTRDRHPCPGGIRTRNPSKRADEDLRLRQSCHWDRQMCLLQLKMDNTIMYIVKLLSVMTCLFNIDNYSLLFIWDVIYIYIYILKVRLKLKLCVWTLCEFLLWKSSWFPHRVLLSPFVIFSNEGDVETLLPTLEHGCGVAVGLILTCGSQHIV